MQRIGYFIVLGTIFLLPIFFLPITSDFYEFNKQTLLYFSSFILLILWAISCITDRQVRLTRSPLGLPILLIVGSFVISTILKTPAKLDAFLIPTETGTYISLGLFFFTSLNFIRTKKELDWTAYTLIASLSLLSTFTILWSSGLISKLGNPLWTPTGNPLTSLILSFSLVPFLLVIIAKEKISQLKITLLSISLFVAVIATGLLSYRLFNPSHLLTLLPQTISRAIALEALKTSTLFGTGPSTFFSDFTQFRPVTYNLLPYWTTRFTQSNNYYLQLLATTGLLGLCAYLFLVFRTSHLLIKSLHASHILPLAALTTALILFGLQIFLPTSFTLITTTFILLLIASSSPTHEAHLDTSPLLPWLILILTIAVILPATYLYGRAYLADYIFQQALQFAAANDGKKTYDTLVLAIKTNPYRDTYRIAYSQTNFLLANNLASQKDLKDTDRNTISQLIQQAIREAKNAVSLNPTKVTNLENLATIYRQLLNFAAGADQWTIASYRQAIQLDPINPNLRIALGGVFFAQKNYDDAIRLFQSAIDLKPDLANAHYNLAVTYREKGDFKKSLASMEQVIKLVDPKSPDFTKVQQELADLQKKVNETAPNSNLQPQASELSAPQPLPSPKITPPLKLDESLSPSSPSTPSSQP